MRRSLLYQVYPVYLVAIVLALAALSFAATRVVRNVLYAERKTELETIANLVISVLEAPVLPPGFSSEASRSEASRLDISRLDISRLETYRILRERLRHLQPGANRRLTIVDTAGTVIADTHGNRLEMDDHRDRPEIEEAYLGRSGIAIRQSTTTGENTLYLAAPFYAPFEYEGEGPILLVLRVAASVAELDRRSRETLPVLLVTAAFILIITALVTMIVARWVQRPLGVIRDAAQHYSRGDLSHRIEIQGPEEITGVADTLNGMAERLAETIESIRDQRNELEAVLTSMVEGVVVVDADRRIRSMNLASQRLFEKEGLEYAGRSLIEHLRNTDLDDFVEEVLRSGAYVERTITLYRPAPVFVQVHGTLLRRQDESEPRVLLVLNDITRMKQLEAMRRDFVANVSHELKTPVTSILGFVETLIDGIPDDPHQARRFLDIISANANRLNLIIEDLLTLSRLESSGDRIDPGEFPLDLMMNRVVEANRDQADHKSIELRLQYDGHHTAWGSENLLEQALANLVENAVKYSGEGGKVVVSATNRPAELTIEVRDTGQGIPAGDVPRIFERFYRVDRARSRELGGTGLGLAIVKHIALAHQGEVTVESAEGVGSTFFLRVPQERL
jgi:two-component system, OmpR family, phosphate regulon sensor histidine kinase PhoR